MIGFGVNFRLMAILRKITEVRPQLPFRNHIGSDLETRRSPSALNEGFQAAGNPAKMPSLVPDLRALAFV
jgi:hypothetical protein